MFRPKDSKGNDVLVYVYNGVTYAPPRALAEAYGLEVGYDAATNTATVNSPTQEAVPEPGARPELIPLIRDDFASQWTITEKPVTSYSDEKLYTATYAGNLTMSEFKAWWKAQDTTDVQREAEKLAAELQAMTPGYKTTMYFDYNRYALGTAYAFGDLEQSNFRPASLWIK